MNRFLLLSSQVLILTTLSLPIAAQQGSAKSLLDELQSEIKPAAEGPAVFLANVDIPEVMENAVANLASANVSTPAKSNNSAPWRWRSSRKKKSTPVASPVEEIDLLSHTPLDGAARKDIEFHTVRSGENMAAIAGFYGIKETTLRALNGIIGARSPIAGQILKLKGNPPASAMAAAKKSTEGTGRVIPRLPMGVDGFQVYTVKSGDNPARIAKNFNVSSKALMELNEVKNARLLKIGQKLRIPKQQLKSEPVFDPQGYDTYVVNVGDSPWTIARKLKIEYHALIGINGITDPTSLKVGQKLKVPKPN